MFLCYTVIHTQKKTKLASLAVCMQSSNLFGAYIRNPNAKTSCILKHLPTSTRQREWEGKGFIWCTNVYVCVRVYMHACVYVCVCVWHLSWQIWKKVTITKTSPYASLNHSWEKLIHTYHYFCYGKSLHSVFSLVSWPRYNFVDQDTILSKDIH